MKFKLLFFLLLSANCFSQLQDGLLLHYKFDGDALDSSGNEHHGSPNYAISYTEDRFGNENSAVLFNGINSYIDLPNLAVLKPELPISFSFWIRFDSEDWRDREVFNTSHEEDLNTGVFLNTEQSTGRYTINYGDGSPAYNPDTRRTYASNDTVVTGKWVNITAIIKNSTDMEIYVNCETSGGTYSGNGGDLQYSTTPGSIGRHDRALGIPANYFKGAIDDFFYWNRELLQEEIVMLCKPLKINSVSKNINFTMFPNPAMDKVHLIKNNIQSGAVVEVFDIMGNMIMQTNFKPEINISAISNGVYIIKVSDEQSSSSKKLIIKR